MSSFVANCKRNKGLTLLIVALLPCLIGLGFWQLQRAEENLLEIDSLAERAKLPVIDYTKLIDSDISEFEYRPVELTGHFDRERYWLLDNRSHESKTGYDVIVPFKPDALKDVTLLINLGWLPASSDRQELPSIRISSEKTTVKGTFRSPIINAIYSGMVSDLEILWPQRVLSINIETASVVLDEMVFPLLVKIDPSHPSAYTENWPIVNMSAATNYGYATQWFAMALTLLIIFIVINRPKKQVKND